MYLTPNPAKTRTVLENAAVAIIHDSANFYSSTQKDDLMDFLNTLT